MKTILSLILCVPLLGCAAMHRPETSLSYNPVFGGFRFHDTKDNDVTLNGLKVNPDTKNIELESFVLRNNASDPINAWVNQMTAQAELNKVTVEALTGMVDRLMAAIPSLTPVIRAVKGTDQVITEERTVTPEDLSVEPAEVLIPG